MLTIHHSAICVRDLDTSLRFWRDGLGLEVLPDGVLVELVDTGASANLDRLASGREDR